MRGGLSSCCAGLSTYCRVALLLSFLGAENGSFENCLSVKAVDQVELFRFCGYLLQRWRVIVRIIM